MMMDDEKLSWYQKKPVAVEVWKYTPSTAMDVYRWVEQSTQGSFDPTDEELPGSGVGSVFARCLATGHWPGYPETITRLHMPMWTARDEEDALAATYDY